MAAQKGKHLLLKRSTATTPCERTGRRDGQVAFDLSPTPPRRSRHAHFVIPEFRAGEIPGIEG